MAAGGARLQLDSWSDDGEVDDDDDDDDDVGPALEAFLWAVSDVANMGVDMLGDMGAAAVERRNRLGVVTKPLVRGARGSVYYVNDRGRVVYLKREQKRACREGRLPGAEAYCPMVIGGYRRRRPFECVPRAVIE